MPYMAIITKFGVGESCFSCSLLLNCIVAVSLKFVGNLVELASEEASFVPR